MENDELDNIIELNDEDGNVVQFEFLDLVELEGEEYVVLLPVASDGEEGVSLALSQNPDLILLDVMLPKADGLTVCKRIRQTLSKTPIIMLSAKGEEIDKILGLEIGADDYMTKPFSVRELIARVKANLRKVEQNDELSASGVRNNKIVVGDLKLDFDKFEVEVRGQKVTDLTRREFEVLRYLAQKPGQVVTREDLLEKVWGYEYYGDIRTVDVTIRRIREKIEKNTANPKILITNTLDKNEAIKRVREDNPFEQIKFYTINELQKNYPYTYTTKTLEYVCQKENVILDVAKIYLSTICIYPVENLNNEKGRFLTTLKQDLLAKKLLLPNTLLKNFLKKSEIILENIHPTKQIQNLLKEFPNISFCQNKTDEKFAPIVYECENIEEEITLIGEKIITLLQEGIDINHIYLKNVSEINWQENADILLLYSIPVINSSYALK